MRTVVHLFRAILAISSVLRMDIDGQKTSSCVSPHSQPAEAGFAVSVCFPQAAVGLKKCCLLQYAGIQLPIMLYPLTFLVHLFQREGVSQPKMLLSTGIVGMLQFGSCTKKAAAGLVLYIQVTLTCEPKVRRKWNVSECGTPTLSGS